MWNLPFAGSMLEFYTNKELKFFHLNNIKNHSKIKFLKSSQLFDLTKWKNTKLYEYQNKCTKYQINHKAKMGSMHIHWISLEHEPIYAHSCLSYRSHPGLICYNTFIIILWSFRSHP